MFDNFFIEEVRNDFNKLTDIKIVHTNGTSLAKHINKFFNNTDNWWNNEKTNKVKNEFCLKYSDQNFNTQLFVNELNKL